MATLDDYKKIYGGNKKNNTLDDYKKLYSGPSAYTPQSQQQAAPTTTPETPAPINWSAAQAFLNTGFNSPISKKDLGAGLVGSNAEVKSQPVPNEVINPYSPKHEVLRQAPPESFYTKVLDFVSTPFKRGNEEQKQRNTLVKGIFERVNQDLTKPTYSYDDIGKNFDNYTKAIGIRSTPTLKETANTLFVLPVVSGLVANPLTTVLGVAGFMALSEAESFAVSKVGQTDYKFGEAKGVADLLPSQTNELTKTAVEVLDFMAKGKALHVAYKKYPALQERFTKDLEVKYNIPRKVYLEPSKIRSIFQTGKEISPAEVDLYKSLGRTGEQVRKDIQNGVSIEIPAEKISTITDKPYWAKIKSFFKIKPETKVTVTLDGKPTQTDIRGELPGPSGEPLTVPVPATVVPNAPATTPNAVAPVGNQTAIRVNDKTTIGDNSFIDGNSKKVDYSVMNNVPGGRSPTAVFKKALQNAGVSPFDVASIMSRVPVIKGETFDDNVVDAINDHNIAVRDYSALPKAEVEYKIEQIAKALEKNPSDEQAVTGARYLAEQSGDKALVDQVERAIATGEANLKKQQAIQEKLDAYVEEAKVTPEKELTQPVSQPYPEAPRIPTTNQVYSGDKFISGTYEGQPYTTDSYVLEFNSKVTAPTKNVTVDGKKVALPKGVVISGKDAVTEAGINKIIPDQTEAVSVEPIKIQADEKGKQVFVTLEGDGVKVDMQKKYYDYFSKKYPGAEFKAVSPVKPVVVTSKGKMVGLIMPADLKNASFKMAPTWEKPKVVQPDLKSSVEKNKDVAETVTKPRVKSALNEALSNVIKETEANYVNPKEAHTRKLEAGFKNLSQDPARIRRVAVGEAKKFPTLEGYLKSLAKIALKDYPSTETKQEFLHRREMGQLTKDSYLYGNPKEIAETKAKYTDIWNEAHGVETVTKPRVKTALESTTKSVESYILGQYGGNKSDTYYVQEFLGKGIGVGKTVFETKSYEEAVAKQKMLNGKVETPSGLAMGKTGKTIKHFTREENIQSILEKGFDVEKAPIHGVGGLEGGAKTNKAGKDVLYFTTDEGRWNSAQVFVGEGKGNISREVYDYDKQTWVKEKDAYQKVDLKSVEASIKSDAKILTISSLQDLLNATATRGGFNPYEVIDNLVDVAREKKYDILNINNKGLWEYKDGRTTKNGDKNWYKTLTGNSGNDDYFILNPKVIELVKPAPAKAPSGLAMAKYQPENLPNLTGEFGGINNIRPIEMPELVRITRELMGKFPEIVKKTGDAAGRFYAKDEGRIKLIASLFNKASADANQAARVLAHEMGHLIDYLPDQMIKRGNLLGRLQVLRKFMDSELDGVKNADIRKELLAVTQYWHPYNPAKVPESYRKYRESSVELYAEALSMLLVDPGKLEKMAPKFYEEFFKSLDKKPDVKEVYFKTQELLNGEPEALFEARMNDILAGFARGEEIQAGFRTRAKLKANSLWDRLNMQVSDKNYAILKKQKIAENKGVVFPDSENPKFVLEEQSLADNENFLMLGDMQTGVINPLEKLGVSQTDIGQYIMLNRIATERAEIANPYGFDVKTATEQLAYLKRTLGDERWAALEKEIRTFHEITFKAITEGLRVGSIRKDLGPDLEKNMYNYGYFRVLDYMQDFVPAGIQAQVGTLKEIANPFHSTILKTISLNRLNAFQRAKNATTSMIKDNFPEDISLSEPKKGPKGDRTGWIIKPEMGLLEVLEDGKIVGYNVEPMIAEAFKSEKVGDLNLFLFVNDVINNKIFKPLVTTYNPAFSMWSNLWRDTAENWKSIPGVTIRQLLTNYIKMYPDAVKFAKGELTDFTRMLVENKAMGAPMNDYSYDTVENEYGKTLEKFGVLAKKPQNYGKFIGGVYNGATALFRGLRFMSNTFENLSKIAGAKIRVELGESGGELASNLRNYTGTPNFRIKGTQTQWSNSMFPFSNIQLQGFKRSYQLAFVNPKTRSGYWWKTVALNWTPTILKYLVAAGGAGIVLERFFANISEYDKTNYIIIPLGWWDTDKESFGLIGVGDQEGEGKKSVYMRIPQDEVGRLQSAILWKALNFSKEKGLANAKDILAIGAGQFPSTSPSIKIANTWMNTYLRGQNSYDSFRGKLLFKEKDFNAGGFELFKQNVKWTTNELGITRFSTYNDASDTTFETFIKNAPWLQSVIKVSDYGITESLTEAGKAVGKERDRKDQKIDIAISNNLKDALRDKENLDKYTGDVIKQSIGPMPEGKTEKLQYLKEALSVQEKFYNALITGSINSPVQDAFSKTNTNEKKAAMIEQLTKLYGPDESFKIIINLLKDKTISEDVTLKFIEKKINESISQ